MLKTLNYYYNKFKFGEDIFFNLMNVRVKEILLVSTFYDAFIFEQDGRLSEQIHGEYQQLNLSTAPRITIAPTGQIAMDLLKTKKFDLVITSMRIGRISPTHLSKYIKENYPELSIILLINFQSDVASISKNPEKYKFCDDVFFWNGDAKVFIAMIKFIEDKWNVDHDTKVGFVRVILLVEDSINYYSMFLPILYELIMKQTQRLISQELNDVNKRLQMRTRPKVLLVHTLEEAEEIVEKYKDNLVAVISDANYANRGIMDDESGVKLISKIRMANYDTPIILQSSEIKNKEKADRLGAFFLHKQSKTLLNDLKKIMVTNLGFGDFIFRDQNGIEIDRAIDAEDFEEKLKTIPEESLIYHSDRNHFSSWLIAHGEIQVAKKIKPLSSLDFNSPSELHKYLIKTFQKVYNHKIRGKIIDFAPTKLTLPDHINKLSDGSLGGKGRGLAFLNSLLVAMDFQDQFPNVRIKLPSTSIIGTNEYDFFIDNNSIGNWITEKTDRKIKEYFVSGKFSPELMRKLKILIERIKLPLAVRSSGLLEDSQSQPFAGIYNTYMIPNSHSDSTVRLKNLCDSIKLVFASVFLKNARKYIESINYKLEEEKMAVIIQEIVGTNFDGLFYPHISGVGQSFNYYPTSYLKNDDGIVSLAAGLGKIIVDGETVFRFCPKYPKMSFTSLEDMMKDSQKNLYCINLKDSQDIDLYEDEGDAIKNIKIRKLRDNNSLNNIASVFDFQNNKIVPGINQRGPIIINFANVLKYNQFPLAQITEQILRIGESAMGVPIEIEFAVNLTKDLKNEIYPSFNLLQIRPLTVNTDEIYIVPDNLDMKELVLFTKRGMGNGIINNISNIIFVDPDTFDKTKMKEMKIEITDINEKMKESDEEYILIGPGRWGSRDHFLGIPVKWADINKAKIIVETDFENFIVDSSQGTHFFHNLISMNVGYFTVPHNEHSCFIDWNWLKKQKIVEKTNYLVHVKIDHNIQVKMDGQSGISLIRK